MLLLSDDGGPVACRRCWHAQYTSDYPGRQQQARLRDVLLRAAGGSTPIDREITLLCARRRRGVRRGRRVLRRAIRLAVTFGREMLLAAPVRGGRPS